MGFKLLSIYKENRINNILLEVSGAKIVSKSWVLIYYISILLVSLSLTKSIKSSLDLHSQIPSHPISKNLSSGPN